PKSTPSTSTSMPSGTWWNAASPSSNSSGASLRASKRPHETISLSSPSPPSSYGYDKCPHNLALQGLHVEVAGEGRKELQKADFQLEPGTRRIRVRQHPEIPRGHLLEPGPAQ